MRIVAYAWLGWGGWTGDGGRIHHTSYIMHTRIYTPYIHTDRMGRTVGRLVGLATIKSRVSALLYHCLPGLHVICLVRPLPSISDVFRLFRPYISQCSSLIAPPGPSPALSNEWISACFSFRLIDLLDMVIALRISLHGLMPTPSHPLSSLFNHAIDLPIIGSNLTPSPCPQSLTTPFSFSPFSPPPPSPSQQTFPSPTQTTVRASSPYSPA
jgi:hypothetical protein